LIETLTKYNNITSKIKTAKALEKLNEKDRNQIPKFELYKDFEGLICLSVKDTGIGISQEYLEDLFNPFTQEEIGYTRKFEGNGLGLAIVKKYADKNNIGVVVKSKKSMGTEFTLVFK